jgi:hypothetical protein
VDEVAPNSGHYKPLCAWVDRTFVNPNSCAGVQKKFERASREGGLHSEIVRYIASPQGREKLVNEMGLIPGAPTSPDELAKFVAKEVEDWGKLVRLAGAAGIE